MEVEIPPGTVATVGYAPKNEFYVTEDIDTAERKLDEFRDRFEAPGLSIVFMDKEKMPFIGE